MATNPGIPVEKQPTETARASLFGSFTLINHGGLPIALSNRRALAILAMRREQISLRLHSLIDSALEDIGNAGFRKRLLGAWAMQQPSVRALFTPVPSDSKTRIAAFAFQVLGSCRRAGLPHLTYGIVDELIAMLGQVPQLLVAGRTSSFHFRDSPLALTQIAGELGAPT